MRGGLRGQEDIIENAHVGACRDTSDERARMLRLSKTRQSSHEGEGVSSHLEISLALVVELPSHAHVAAARAGTELVEHRHDQFARKRFLSGSEAHFMSA